MAKINNKLLYGDNLGVMAGMASESVDLIYLDPPFNSDRDYNAIFETSTGIKLPEAIKAFKDTWQMTPEKYETLKTMPIKMAAAGMPRKDSEMLKVFLDALVGNNDELLAYLLYMVERLIEMNRILKTTGSIYLHCDPTASHYLKMAMDCIFGKDNFRNEIVWHYTGGGRSKRYFSKKHDYILFYTKSNDYTFNVDAIRVPYKESSGFAKGGIVSKSGKHYKPHPDGTPVDSVWDIPIINPMSKERLDYPTQKPRLLLERIVSASSVEGDMVLDPFCGCGTTIEAAERLNRKWMGIDITIHAIKRVCEVRLVENLNLEEGVHYEVEGRPNSFDSAKTLFKKDSYNFQKWCVETIDGYVTVGKSGDKGVDGILYFQKDMMDKTLSQMILEVKGGGYTAENIRSLRGAMESEKADMAGFIHLEPMGEQQKKNFESEMAKAGMMKVNGVNYPRMQILSVEEIIEGKNFKVPNRIIEQNKSQDSLRFGTDNGKKDTSKTTKE